MGTAHPTKLIRKRKFIAAQQRLGVLVPQRIERLRVVRAQRGAKLRQLLFDARQGQLERRIRRVREDAGGGCQHALETVRRFSAKCD